MHRIDGPGATVDNKFTDGDVVGAVPATVVTDDWLNDVQENVMAVLDAAAIPPVKGRANDLLDGIKKVAQVNSQFQAGTAFTTAGTAPSFTLTPSPAITAYAANQRFQVKFHAGGAGSDTINVSGLGAKNLKQYDSSGNKISAVIQGQLTDVVYDGTDFVMLDALPGNSQATETVLGSVKIATQAVTNAGLDDTTAITPLKLAQLRAASTISSTPVTMTSGGIITISNPWGTAPSSINLILTCAVPEIGYSINDRIYLGHSGSGDGGSSSTNSPIGVWDDVLHTAVNARIGTQQTLITNKLTGLSTYLTFANWKISLEITR
ncbi:hypothetical protein [Pseudomonas agarici]|uniref:hypothetical protein n=1 Tax=Pseudomonas agarici TaxID=46677 RepID=UPI0015A4D80D|nr:hypothetical protein [Pseudomonas agarici]NWB92342.1 hypothetical protein [Pseudomonas agarici]